MAEEQIFDLIFKFGPAIATLILGYVVKGWQDWKVLKVKFKKFRQLIISVDDALYDDVVTEQEFRDIWQKAKDLWFKEVDE